MVSFNFSQKSLHLPWNFSQISPSLNLNKELGPCSWLLYVLSSFHLHPWCLQRIQFCAFLCGDYCWLVLFFHLSQPLHCPLLLIWFCLQKLAGREGTLNLLKITLSWIVPNSIIKLLTSFLSKDLQQSSRNKLNLVSITFKNFPAKHLSWAIANL